VKEREAGREREWSHCRPPNVGCDNTDAIDARESESE